jgi:hypothetical protein
LKKTKRREGRGGRSESEKADRQINRLTNNSCQIRFLLFSVKKVKKTATVKNELLMLWLQAPRNFQDGGSFIT